MDQERTDLQAAFTMILCGPIYCVSYVAHIQKIEINGLRDSVDLALVGLEKAKL